MTVVWLLVLLAPLPAAADTLTIGGSGAVLSTIRLLADAAADTLPDVTVRVLPSLGSTGGIRALQDSHVDLAVTSRPLTDDERATGLRSFHLADTPIAFVSSRSGPLDVSADRVVELFAQICNHWPDGTPVRIILRPEQESLYRRLATDLPGFAEAIASAYRRPEIPIAATDQENVNLARMVFGSFTAATLAQVMTEAPDLTIVSLDGVAPSAEHIVDGRYPLAMPFFLVASPQASEPARRFLDFVLSSDAASVLAGVGQIPAGDRAALP